MTERREFPRIAVTFRACFGPFVFGEREGTILDLAMTGCRLKSNLPVLANTYLSLSFKISPTDQRILVDFAAVRWVCDGHLGIEFLTLQPEQHTRLKKLIETTPPDG